MVDEPVTTTQPTPPVKEQPKTIVPDPRTHAAIVEKSMDDDNFVGHYPLFGVTSFSDLEELQQSEMATSKLRELSDYYQIMVSNIMRDGETLDKAAALRSLTDEYQSRLDTLSSNVEKEATEEDEALATPGNGFTVWKEASGDYRWLSIYSNRYRDKDHPPEIISEKSHKMFVEMVDKGIAPYPELWHWHVPGSRWGVADWVEYADGFALASGTVDKGHEHEAETLSKSKTPIRVSHGMPVRFIKRNQDDTSVIDFHITTEISDLPAPAAANPLTDFQLLKEGKPNMALSAEKKLYLKDVAGLSDEAIAKLENGLTTKAKEAEDQGLQFKETPAEEPVAAPEPVAVKEPVIVKEETAPVYATREEVADAMAEVLNGLTEQIQNLTTAVKELQRPDAERIAEKAANTPPASLAALIAQRVIGNDATLVDGRTTLAKDRPPEAKTKEQANGPTPFSFINTLVEQSRHPQ